MYNNIKKPGLFKLEATSVHHCFISAASLVALNSAESKDKET
jgi:hypothetical protein